MKNIKNNKKLKTITFSYKNELELFNLFDIISHRLYSLNQQLPGYNKLLESKENKKNWTVKQWRIWFDGIHQLKTMKIVTTRQNQQRQSLGKWKEEIKKQKPDLDKNFKEYYEKENELFALNMNESIDMIDSADWGIKDSIRKPNYKKPQN